MREFGFACFLVVWHLTLFGDIRGHSGLTDEEISKFNVSGKFEATVRVETQSDRFIIHASGMPDHNTEKVNPNDPSIQNYQIPIPKIPQPAQVPGCLMMDMIGITRTGVSLFNPLDGQSQNAVEGPGAEVFDSCDGHSNPTGAYHYHKLPHSCLYKHEVDEFIGVALDGYPIYGPIVSAGLIMTGNLSEGGNVTSDHLDKCHGTTVNGKYRYYMTYEFPYILGCFKGTILHRSEQVQYNCVNDTSNWPYYLCHCSQNQPNPEMCAPHNPNRNAEECDRLCNQPGPRRPRYCDATTTTPTTQHTIRVTNPIDGAENIFPRISVILFSSILLFLLTP